MRDFLEETELKEYENRKFTWVEIGRADYLLYNITPEKAVEKEDAERADIG